MTESEAREWFKAISREARRRRFCMWLEALGVAIKMAALENAQEKV